MGRLTMGGLAGRFLAALARELVTYNPTGLSFLGWVAVNFPRLQTVQAVIEEVQR